MAKRGASYTPLGRKIFKLARNQAELAKSLMLTQQSVSGKLNGRIAITLEDLERLSEQYEVPLLYFMTPENVTPDMARAWMRLQDGPPEIMTSLMLAADLPLIFLRQLVSTVEAIARTSRVLTAREGMGVYGGLEEAESQTK
jgi:hypothetical protein